MTIKDQLTAVQSALETWAENEGGRAYIASDRLRLEAYRRFAAVASRILQTVKHSQALKAKC